jgi:hypothetical protein
MKHFKLILLIAVLLFIVVFVVQNRTVLSHEESFALNLYVKSYHTPPFQLSIYFLGFFLIGFLLSYFHALSERFKGKNVMKNHLEKISKLEEEIKALKSLPLQEETPPSPETEQA